VSIRIRRLRLLGKSKNYEVRFLRDGERLPLAVIAGEIATGKTSVLEFIDYCLGGSTHPQHPEIQRQAQTALLEIELNGDIVVLDRALFSTQNFAWVHQASLDDFDVPHARSRRSIDPPSAEDSLSTFLLEALGLAGIDLKEAPTKAESKTQPMSIRDLLSLAYLDDSRIGTENLLFENAWFKNLKLQQVIEVVFGVHDEQLTNLNAQLDQLRETRREAEAALATLRSFLDEQEIAGPLELSQQEQELRGEEGDARAKLQQVEHDMQSATEFAGEQRSRYAAAREAAGQAAAAVRYQETLMTRLLPLRGQYAEDERKLQFYAEAKTLFDPLHVTICPSCQQPLSTQVEIREGVCTLCHQHVPVGDEPLDLKTELDAVRGRRQELERYIAEVDGEIAAANREAAAAAAVEEEARGALDAVVATRLSPYVARRDEAVRALERVRAQIAEKQRQLGWWQAVDQRQIRVLRLTEQIDTLRGRINELMQDRPTREALVRELSQRFERMLKDFGFPKLYDGGRPHLDEKFAPVVRGMPYRDIGSKGAKALAAIAWALSIYELAIETDAPHPGFLMIDSPQQGLRPEGAGAGDEFTHAEIGDRVWARLVETATTLPNDPQLIVVDNLPRTTGQPYKIVEYTGEPGLDPYGLIDNEEDASA
jgi:hypothetical protein